MSQPGHTGMRTALAVIIPCYNAGDRLCSVVERALREVDTVIVVDDGSTDGAADNLEVLGAGVERLWPNRGKGHAMLAGFRAALARDGIQYVATMDADGQHDPAELPNLYAAAVNGADLVIGSRVFNKTEIPWRSRFGNKLTRALTRVLIGQRLPDTQSGYRILSRAFAEAVVDSIPGGRYETEMAILAMAIQRKRRIASVPIQTIYEAGNKSSHFRPVRDSFLVYRSLLRAVLRRR